MGPADLGVEVIEKILSEHSESDRRQLSFSLSGVFGDPIYHPDFLIVMKLIKDSGAYVNIVTNGAYREDTWWDELASLVDERDHLIFSIDGLAGSHEIYRKFGNYEQSMRALMRMRSTPAKVTWKYIVFPHNKEFVSQARELAAKLEIGFDLFQTDRTNNDKRFIQDGEHWKPGRLRRKEAAKLILKKVAPHYEGPLSDILEIIPQCERGDEPTFISHEAKIFPCCRPTADFYGSKEDRGDAEPFLTLSNEWSLANQSIQAAMDHPFFDGFLERLKQHPESAPYICQKNCSRVTEKGLKLLEKIKR